MPQSPSGPEVGDLVRRGDIEGRIVEVRDNYVLVEWNDWPSQKWIIERPMLRYYNVAKPQKGSLPCH